MVACREREIERERKREETDRTEKNRPNKTSNEFRPGGVHSGALLATTFGLCLPLTLLVGLLATTGCLCLCLAMTTVIAVFPFILNRLIMGFITHALDLSVLRAGVLLDSPTSLGGRILRGFFRRLGLHFSL